MKTARLLLLALLLPGCTSFHVIQTDDSPGQRTTRTDLRATAWFSSTQSLSKIKALQTEKTQSFGSDALSQQGATNTTAALEALVKILQLLRPTP